MAEQPKPQDQKPPKAPTYAPALPIAAPWDEDRPPVEVAEERAPADPLEHFRKRECAHGHKNWDPDKIVYSMDNKRWMLKCMTCVEHGIPAWYTISGSAMAVQEAAGLAPK